MSKEKGFCGCRSLLLARSPQADNNSSVLDQYHAIPANVAKPILG